MREISCYTYSSTSFYVVVEPSVIQDRQLRMPDRFVQEHGDELLDTVRLILPTDEFWSVGLKRSGKMIWLHDGWQEFMEHHSIDCWYFLLFKYGQNSCFNVHIFDLTAAEIHYRLRNHGNAKLQDISQDLSHGKEKVVGDNDGGSSVEIVVPLKTEEGPESSAKSSELSHGAKRCKLAPGKSKFWRCDESRSKENRLPVSSSRTNCKTDTSKSFTGQQLEKSVRSGRPQNRGRPWTAEVNRAINAAKMFIPKNPYFTKILVEYNVVRSYTLNISAEFVREYMPKTSNVIELQDCDGNKWNVRCIRRKDQIYLSKGWSNFVKDTSLVAGDVCVFELITDIQTAEHMLKVHIFHSRVEESSTNLHTCSVTEPTLPVSKTCILQFSESKDTESSDASEPLSSNKTNCKTDMDKSSTSQQLEESVRRGRPPKRGRPLAAEANRSINSAKIFMPKDPYFMQIHYRLRSHGNARLHHISQDLSHGKKIGGDNDGESSVEIVNPLETEQGPESSAKSSELFHGAKKRKIAPGRHKFLRCYETRSKANRLHDKGQVLNAKNLNMMGDISLTKPLLGKLVQQNMDTSTYSAVVAGGVPNQDNAREGSKNEVYSAVVAGGVLNQDNAREGSKNEVCSAVVAGGVPNQDNAREGSKNEVYSAVVAGGVPNQDNAREGSKNDTLQRNESKQTSSDVFGPVSSNRTNCNDTSKSFAGQQLEKSVRCGRPHKRERSWAAEANRAINAAKLFMPKNPSFTAVLAKYNVVRHHILNIPTEFAREYIPKTSNVIELQDCDGNKWNVCCIRRKDQIYLGKGWLNFVRDNSLEVRDVCVFEFIKELQADELMLKVHIFRARVEQNATTLDTLVAYLNQLSISM